MENKVFELLSSCVIYQFSEIVLTRVLPELTVLSMAHNHLKMLIEKYLKKILFFSHLFCPINSIQYLPSDFSNHLRQLENLDLGHNNLLILDSDLLGALSLSKLDLFFNSIQIIPKDALSLTSRPDSLALDGNQFHCNCELLLFYNWMCSSMFSRNKMTHSDCASLSPLSLRSMRVNDFLWTPPSCHHYPWCCPAGTEYKLPLPVNVRPCGWAENDNILGPICCE